MAKSKKDLKKKSSDTSEEKGNRRSAREGYFLTMGISLGVGFGLVFDNIPMALAIGVAIGGAIEWLRLRNKKEE